jgi:hypothetical protein
MRSLTDFLANLPGIMPIKTRRLVLEGDLLSAAERGDIRSRDRSFLDSSSRSDPMQRRQSWPHTRMGVCR